MKQKNGITLTMLVVIVAGLIIISTATVNIISNSYTNSKLSVWIMETQLVQDMVDENKNNISKYLLDDVVLDMSELKSEERLRQADGEVIIDGKVRLKELNLTMLGIENSVYGSKKEESDTYAYSTLTGKVYYIKGMDARTNIYYTLTEELKNRYENVLNTSKLSLITFEQSEIIETENAVKVTVKVPKAYTNVVITTGDANILISNVEEKEDKNVYTVNTSEIIANYTITVTYTDGETSKTVTHTVNNVK